VRYQRRLAPRTRGVKAGQKVLLVRDSSYEKARARSSERFALLQSRLQLFESGRVFIRAADKPAPLHLIHGFETGTAKYAVNTPVVGSTALPVISPLLFMSLALSR